MKNFLIISFVAFTLSTSAQRVVLIEQFTNASCPNCAASTPAIYNFVDSNKLIVVSVAYHTVFPHFDSLYHENPSDVDKRVAFYNVSSVPYTCMDGYYGSQSYAFKNVIADSVSKRKNISSQYTISFLHKNIHNAQVSASVVFKSLTNQLSTDTLIAFVAIIENEVFRSTYNGASGNNTEDVYKYAMRKLLPNADGKILVNTSINGSDTLNVTWDLNTIKTIKQNAIRFVAFVQNKRTKEIQQAQMIQPVLNEGLNELSDQNNAIKTYPNPFINEIYISKNSLSTVELFDMQGKLITKETNIGNCVIKDLEQLSSGLYFLKVIDDNGSRQFKMIKQ